MSMKHPLTDEHYKLLDQSGRLLSEFAAYASKLDACGEDCEEMKDVARQLDEKRKLILQEFPRQVKSAG